MSNIIEVADFCKRHSIVYGNDKIFSFLRDLPEKHEQMSLF